LKAPDQLVGKNVKCPGCGASVLVKAVAAAPAQAAANKPVAAKAPAQAPVKKKPPVEEEVDDVEDLDEEEEPAPKKKPVAKKPVKRDDDVEDLDEEDEAPKKNAITKKPSKKSDDFEDLDDEDEPKAKKKKGRDEEEDEDDDAPKKKSKKGKKTSGSFDGGPTTDEERNTAFMFYVILFIGSAIGIGPLGGIIWWVIKRKESRFVDHQGKQYINHAITMFVYYMGLMLVGGGLAGVLGYFVHAIAGAVVGGLLFLAFMGLAIYSLIIFIRGLLKAKAGEWWTWPMTWQILK